ncbi:putative CLAVATA3/ESR (CLE)-related protein 25-like [Capsicum annuum]|nr:putative CLAVATA3/ESR (CLE)-related protein 25-like [Capsicum annuum]
MAVSSSHTLFSLLSPLRPRSIVPDTSLLSSNPSLVGYPFTATNRRRPFIITHSSKLRNEVSVDKKRQLLEQYGLNPDEFLSEPSPKRKKRKEQSKTGRGEQVLEEEPKPPRETHKLLQVVGGTARRKKLLSPKSMDVRPMMEVVKAAAFGILQAAGGCPASLRPGRWLDLYSGTGSVGIEAISRGCSEVHFVEMDPWVVSDVLRPNLEWTGFLDVSVIHTVRVETFLERAEHFLAEGLSETASPPPRGSGKVFVQFTPRLQWDFARYCCRCCLHMSFGGVGVGNFLVEESDKRFGFQVGEGGIFDYISVTPPYAAVDYSILMNQISKSSIVGENTFIVVEYPLRTDMLDSCGCLVKISDRRFGRTHLAIYGPKWAQKKKYVEKTKRKQEKLDLRREVESQLILGASCIPSFPVGNFLATMDNNALGAILERLETINRGMESILTTMSTIRGEMSTMNERSLLSQVDQVPQEGLGGPFPPIQAPQPKLHITKISPSTETPLPQNRYVHIEEYERKGHEVYGVYDDSYMMKGDSSRIRLKPSLKIERKLRFKMKMLAETCSY